MTLTRRNLHLCRQSGGGERREPLILTVTATFTDWCVIMINSQSESSVKATVAKV